MDAQCSLFYFLLPLTPFILTPLETASKQNPFFSNNVYMSPMVTRIEVYSLVLYWGWFPTPCSNGLFSGRVHVLRSWDGTFSLPSVYLMPADGWGICRLSHHIAQYPFQRQAICFSFLMNKRKVLSNVYFVVHHGLGGTLVFLSFSLSFFSMHFIQLYPENTQGKQRS